MRVNPDTRTGLLAALDRTNTTEQQVLKQMSSGLRIQTPSDDPAGAAAVVQVQSADSQTEQYLSDVKAMRTRMQASDSALNAVELALQRAVTLGVGGATGTLSQADRDAIANELSGIKDQLLELSNSSLQGVYLFAGTAVSSPAYIADASSPSGVAYQGNDQSNQVEIGQDYWISANVPGSAIFGDDNTGVFKAMSDLISAVQNGVAVDAANSTLQDLSAQVSAARVQYGNGMNQVDSSEGIMNDRHVQLQQQLTDIAGVDMAKAASDLVTAETSRNALLQVIAKSNGLSLFDYLK
jgi:flagellar hook-associated protein 3 FlgL